jgi:hypothetical protein
VASIERTAYPRFKRTIAAKELREAFTPGADEVAWAREATRAPGHLLGLVVLLKCFQRLGYFPKLADVPAAVVEHVRDCLELPGDVALDYDADRTLRHHKALVRDRLGVLHAPEQARKLAEEAIGEAAWSKDNPADLINVALKELVRGRYELPGYTTLDELAARVRAEVNTELFATIGARLTGTDRAGLERLLEVDPATRRSGYDRLKQPAKAATLTKFKQHLAHLAWLDGLGPARAWLAGIPPPKVAHFAGEAHVTDVADLRKMSAARRLALVVCLLHQAQVRHAPLMERFYRSHRLVLFALLDALELQPTSADRTVLDAVAFLKANRHRIGELVSDQLGDAAAPARQPLPPQPPVPGLPRAGPRGPHNRAAALPVRAQAQRLDRGGHQPDGGLQRLCQVAAVRQRWSAGRQRPRPPGEARQVQRAAGQPGDLPPHRGHHRGGQPARRRGWSVDPDDLATISPYLQGKVRRFGDWVLDLSPPEAGVPTELDLDLNGVG